MRRDEHILYLTRPLREDDRCDHAGWPAPDSRATFADAADELEAWVLRARAQAVEDAVMQLAAERVLVARGA